jgi:hypothetical protein
LRKLSDITEIKITNYRLLQERIKPYKKAGYTNIPLNSNQTTLEAEYHRLLQLELSQDILEQDILNQKVTQVQALDPLDVEGFPERYSLKLIKTKIFQLADVNNLKELLQKYPIIKDKYLDFRFKSSWVECLKIIAEVTQQSRDNQEFYQAVDRAIEIELKSREDDFYRHETPDPDLFTLLSDHQLIGENWEKEQNKYLQASLKRNYIISKCEEVGLDKTDFMLN